MCWGGRGGQALAPKPPLNPRLWGGVAEIHFTKGGDAREHQGGDDGRRLKGDGFRPLVQANGLAARIRLRRSGARPTRPGASWPAGMWQQPSGGNRVT